ncbi:MAG: glycosyl hydrolase family 18 protein [Clostridia bacterium]
MKEFLRIRYAAILTICIVLVIVIVSGKTNQTKTVSKLVIFGDNIQTDFKPFVEESGIYISSDTIGKTIDSNIFYDNIASKIIVTTNSDVAKFKVGEKKIELNFEKKDISNEVKKVNNKIYVPINELTGIYNIDVNYNKKEDVITIDKKDNDIVLIKYNKTDVYLDIKTDSKVISKLTKNDKLIVYTDSLKHNRWLKVKTGDNVVGYIFKDSATIQKFEEAKEENISKEKVVMFWQYGNNLDVLGNSKTGNVNVVSPTLYEVSNSKGDITSKKTSEYVTKAKSLGYKVWPIITNGIDNASYSTSDTSKLMNSESSRENLIKNILKILKEDNLDGINIDFENMLENDRLFYTQFIRELAPLVRKEGKVLSVDMYFVKYIDRAGVGAAADYVMLMGYDQRGSWSSESGSISEISWVEENINSLIKDSGIPANKIILGIPFYTRLWTEKVGSTKPTTTIYTMKQALEYVNKNNLKPKYDEKSGQNYVEHTKGSLTYKMWIEDASSVKKRIEVVNNNKLGGIAAWRKDFETPDIWNVIKDNIVK